VVVVSKASISWRRPIEGFRNFRNIFARRSGVIVASFLDTECISSLKYSAGAVAKLDLPVPGMPWNR